MDFVLTYKYSVYKCANTYSLLVADSKYKVITTHKYAKIAYLLYSARNVYLIQFYISKPILIIWHARCYNCIFTVFIA